MTIGAGHAAPRRCRDGDERDAAVVHEMMRRAAHVQRVTMATGPSCARHDQIDVLGLGRLQQLLPRIALQQKGPVLDRRAPDGGARLVESLALDGAPLLDRLGPDVREWRDPHCGDDEVAAVRVHQGLRPTQGGPARCGSVRTNQDADSASFPRPSHVSADHPQRPWNRAEGHWPRDIPRGRVAAWHTESKPTGSKRPAWASLGRSGARTSASGSGAPCARTTAPAAPRGTTSPTTRPARAPTSGARTASRASATTRRSCASRSRCGTASTRSSRSGCSASPTRRATTART